MTSEIENHFLEIENLIKLQLQDNVQNQPEVKQKFKKAKSLIDELEEVNVEQYGLFKYKYHTKYASYLKTVDDVDNASKQENLAKSYEKYVEKSEDMDSYKTNTILFTEATLGDINKDFNPNEDYMQAVIEEQLNMIRGILEDNVIEDIRQAFKKFDEVPKSFEDYRKIVICDINLLKVVDNLVNEGLIALEELPTSNTNENKEQ